MIEKKGFKPIEAIALLEQADWEALVQQVQQLPSEITMKKSLNYGKVKEKTKDLRGLLNVNDLSG